MNPVHSAKAGDRSRLLLSLALASPQGKRLGRELQIIIDPAPQMRPSISAKDKYMIYYKYCNELN